MLTSDENTIYLYDVIGRDLFGEGIGSVEFKSALEGIADNAQLFINSPGGDVQEGIAIINLIRRFKESGRRVDVFIDSVAASMASGIAMEGDSITMADNSLMMIHAPWTMAAGNSRDMGETADFLDKVQGALSVTYQAKSGKSALEMDGIFEGELWLNAQEAVDAGFADKIAGESLTKASLNEKKLNFKSCPDQLKGSVAAFHIEPVKHAESFSVDENDAQTRLLNRLWQNSL